jgi:basic amino acid/polyamine antiporter, APA family
VRAPRVVGIATMLGCFYLLTSLPSATIVRFLAWNAIGLVVYVAYGRVRRARAAATP